MIRKYATVVLLLWVGTEGFPQPSESIANKNSTSLQIFKSDKAWRTGIVDFKKVKPLNSSLSPLRRKRSPQNCLTNSNFLQAILKQYFGAINSTCSTGCYQPGMIILPSYAPVPVQNVSSTNTAVNSTSSRKPTQNTTTTVNVISSSSVEPSNKTCVCVCENTPNRINDSCLIPTDFLKQLLQTLTNLTRAAQSTTNININVATPPGCSVGYDCCQ